MKAQITIQNLIDRNNAYKAKAWFSKNQFFQNFWDKLTSAYSNLNHVMASEIVEAVKNNPDPLKFDGGNHRDTQYAENFAQLLVNKRVSISALVGVMRANKLSFSGQHFYKFLDALHKGYVREPGLFTEEVVSRMEAVKALPYDGGNLSKDEKTYIQDAKTPLELVDMLIQKPDSKSFSDYPEFVASAVKGVDGKFIDTARKTEVILLGLKNLMNYENLYTDSVEVKKADVLADLDLKNKPIDGKIAATSESDCVTKIEGFISDKEADAAKKTALATKLFNLLNAAGLIGTGYEKSVVEYVAGVTEENRDKAIAYSIYQARKAVKAEVQEAANALRKSLLGIQQIDLIKTDTIQFQKAAKQIAIKKLLEKAANSGRLQRAAKRYVMKKLYEIKLKDAAAIFLEKDSLQAMTNMLTLISQITSSTMAEIQSEHNFNPEFWARTMSRGWNKVASYPLNAFFDSIRYVMKKLYEIKLKEAAAIVSGKGNLQAMAYMLGSIDQETFTLIGQIMSSTMAEIKSEHNFNPEFWAGTMSIVWNDVTSYPADAFFAVIDFFAIVFEYIGEYVTRGAYKAYEGIRGVAEDQKRQNQDIFRQADVEAAMAALVVSLKDLDTKQVKSNPKEELRDAIITFFKGDNNSADLQQKSADLQQKLKAVHSSIEDGELKNAIGRIKDKADLTQHKKDLQAILDMPEMNQNISNALLSWVNAAKAVSILDLIK